MLRGVPPPAVDPTPEGEGCPACEGPRAARSGPYLQRDRRRARRIEELSLALGTRHAAAWPPELRGVPKAQRRRRRERIWEDSRTLREARRHFTCETAVAEIGKLTDREILIAGAIAYWCEGTKSKRLCSSGTGHASSTATRTWSCSSSDFLAVAGVTPDRLVCRLHIHESADVDAAQAFWRRSYRTVGRTISPANAQAAQSEDRPEEHRSRLPRLPDHQTFCRALSCTARSKAGQPQRWLARCS